MSDRTLGMRVGLALVPPFVALLVALVCGDLLILLFGQSPREVYALLIEGALGNAYGIGQVLYKTTTLTLAGLAVAFALRGGLFNIGAESQIAAGGFLAALAGLTLPAATPVLIAVPVCLFAAAVGGGVVGWVPGVLRTKFGAHEVIVTIMLNFIVLAILNWLVASHLNVQDTLHTREIQAGALPQLERFLPALHGSAVNAVLFVALAAVVWATWYLFRSRGGYEVRAVGLQPDVAEYGGIRVGRVWIRAMTISGMLAGLAGTNYVLGYKHYYEDGFVGGAGFLAIAVAIVGRNHPIGVVFAALFFAILSQGGLAIHAAVPKQMVEVLQGVVILAVAIAVPVVRRAVVAPRKAAA